MGRWTIGLVLALGLSGWGGTGAWAQVRERDVTITGPGGRTIERDLRSVRVPGGIERQTTIRRPGGTFQSDTFIQRPHGMGPPRGFVPSGFGGPRPFIERDVFIQNRGINPGAALLGGVGLFGLGMFTGSALSAPPPPPVIYAPAPPPAVVYVPPRPYLVAPAAPPATVVVDPVAAVLPRLQSQHDHSRRDACVNLGRMRDPRAVPGLIDHLKNDRATEVRVAAATALGEIGDPRSAEYLEKSIIYDKKQAVRDAATQSLARLPQPAVAASAPIENRAVSVPSLEPPVERVPPPPRPDR